jgi:hypothetical protein
MDQNILEPTKWAEAVTAFVSRNIDVVSEPLTPYRCGFRHRLKGDFIAELGEIAGRGA